MNRQPRIWGVLLVGALIVPCAILTSMVVGTALVEWRSDCDEGERRVLLEFPQYGGVTPEVVERNDSCAMYYDTRDRARPVMAYFERELVTRGWRFPEGGGRAVDARDYALSGTRGRYWYVVDYLDGAGSAAPGTDGTALPNRILVRVYRR